MAPALPAAGCHGRTLGVTEEGQGEGNVKPTYTGEAPFPHSHLWSWVSASLGTRAHLQLCGPESHMSYGSG